MGSTTDFDQLFISGSKAHDMGLALRTIIYKSLDNITETIAGGAKVKLALYSRNGKNNVLCGIQQGSRDTCMLYVHHCNEVQSDTITFTGKGKHAKRVKFSNIEEIVEEDITWLLTQVDKNAPYRGTKLILHLLKHSPQHSQKHLAMIYLLL